MGNQDGMPRWGHWFWRTNAALDMVLLGALLQALVVVASALESSDPYYYHLPSSLTPALAEDARERPREAPSIDTTAHQNEQQPSWHQAPSRSFMDGLKSREENNPPPMRDKAFGRSISFHIPPHIRIHAEPMGETRPAEVIEKGTKLVKVTPVPASTPFMSNGGGKHLSNTVSHSISVVSVKYSSSGGAGSSPGSSASEGPIPGNSSAPVGARLSTDLMQDRRSTEMTEDSAVNNRPSLLFSEKGEMGPAIPKFEASSPASVQSSSIKKTFSSTENILARGRAGTEGTTTTLAPFISVPSVSTTATKTVLPIMTTTTSISPTTTTKPKPIVSVSTKAPANYLELNTTQVMDSLRTSTKGPSMESREFGGPKEEMAKNAPGEISPVAKNRQPTVVVPTAQTNTNDQSIKRPSKENQFGVADHVGEIPPPLPPNLKPSSAYEEKSPSTFHPLEHSNDDAKQSSQLQKANYPDKLPAAETAQISGAYTVEETGALLNARTLSSSRKILPMPFERFNSNNTTEQASTVKHMDSSIPMRESDHPNKHLLEMVAIEAQKDANPTGEHVVRTINSTASSGKEALSKQQEKDSGNFSWKGGPHGTNRTMNPFLASELLPLGAKEVSSSSIPYDSLLNLARDEASQKRPEPRRLEYPVEISTSGNLSGVRAYLLEKEMLTREPLSPKPSMPTQRSGSGTTTEETSLSDQQDEEDTYKLHDHEESGRSFQGSLTHLEVQQQPTNRDKESVEFLESIVDAKYEHDEYIPEGEFLSRMASSPSSTPSSNNLLDSKVEPEKTMQSPVEVSTIVGISMGALLFILLGSSGLMIFVYYHKLTLNKPRTLDDRFAGSDSGGISTLTEDPFRRISHIDCSGFDLAPCRDTYCEEMTNLDNDSFLNSLETVVVPRSSSPYWSSVSPTTSTSSDLQPHSIYSGGSDSSV